MRTKRSKKLVSILLALVLLLTGIGPNVFAAEPESPDLAVMVLSPANGAGGVDPGAALVITFNQAVNINRADGAAYDIVITDEENNTSQAELTANTEQTVWTADLLEGQTPLTAGHTYTISNRITSEPGSEVPLCIISAAEDNSQTLDFPVWSFATIPVTIQDEGTTQAGSPEQGEGPDQGELGTVHVRVTDEVARQAPELDQLGAAYKQPFGEILPWTEVVITAGMSMMDAIEAALSADSITTYTTTTGYGTYISGIGPVTSSDGSRTVEKLSEADSGSASGWMTTLNGWFPSSGADAVTVQDGDYIELCYSCNYGADLGADWTNPDTTLKSLTVSAGTLSPEFASATKDYTLTLPEAAAVTVQPVAANRNNQVTIQSGGTTYRPTDSISVDNGQIITITCAGNTYTLTVVIQAAPGANHIPARKTGVEAAAAAQVPVRSAYTLDLAAIFEDEDEGDALTYKVKINDAEAVAADVNYSYTPPQAGVVTLVFTANDGTADSTDTYTVTLTVTTAPVLRVKINDGAELPGDSLQAIIEEAGITDLTTITKLEFTYGKVTATDLQYSIQFTGLQSLTSTYEVDLNGGVLTYNYQGVNKAALSTVILPTVTQLSSSAFSSFTALTMAEFENAKTIGGGAFQSCTALKRIYLPNADTLNNSAFKGCAALTEVILPNVVTVGTTDVFRDCTSLTAVYLPKATPSPSFRADAALTRVWLPSAASLPSYAFNGCSSLAELYLEQAPMSAGSNVFTGTPAEKVVYVPAGYVDSYKTFGDGSPSDGKWYGGEVRSLAESGTLGAFVEQLIEQLPAYENLKLADYHHVVSLRHAYDKLTDTQKASVSSYSALTAAEAKIQTLGAAAVSELQARIDSLPDVITLDYKFEVDNIRFRFNSLPAEFQDDVGASRIAKLDLAQGGIIDIEAGPTIQLIAALPATEALQLSDKAAVVAARASYNALNSEQRAGISNYDLLLAAEVKISQLEIDHAKSLIAALPAPDALQLSDKDAVAAARAAYNALTPAQKSSIDNYSLLVAVEDKMTDIEARAAAQTFDSMVAALPAPDNITYADLAAAQAALNAYLAMSDLAKGYTTASMVEKLSGVFDVLAPLQSAQLKSDHVASLIDALPATADITLSHKAAVEAAKEAYEALSEAEKTLVAVDKAAKLQAAVDRIAQLIAETPAVASVSLTVEKFTIGQGFYIEPLQVELQGGDNGALLVARVLGAGNYTSRGSITSDFYLESIKDNSTATAVIPPHILEAIQRLGDSVGGRADPDYLREFDYYGMSGWMYTVNNALLGYGLSDYVPQAGDVIRLQFSVYGYGEDIGYGQNPLIVTADKTALIAKVAGINADPDKSLMFTDAVYKGYYDNALAVIENLQASQAQVNDALAALNTEPDINLDLGTVMVTVQDIVARQTSTYSSSAGLVSTPLTGLGLYQEPFGSIIENVEVPIAPGMTVRQAIARALISQGYYVDGTLTSIKGIGPVTSDDNRRTVAYLSSLDCGPNSKWVMTQNNWCIFDTSKDYHVEDGDVLTLEYTVDSGFDIHCHPNSGDYLTVSFTVAGTVYDATGPYYASNTSHYYMLPRGTTEMTIRAERELHYAGRDINRYLVVEIQTGGVSVFNKPATISVADDQVINIICDNRSGAPISVGGKTYNYIIDIKRLPAEVEDLIAALPAPAQLIYADKARVDKARRCYDYLSDDEKAQVSSDSLATLAAAETRIIEIFNANKAEADRVNDLIKALPNVLKGAVVTLADREAIETARAAYEALTDDQKALCSSWIAMLTRAETALQELLDSLGGTEGVPKNYTKDFLLSTLALNLTAGQEREMVLFDTPRVGSDDQAFNRDDMVLDVTGDEGVIEIEKRIVNDGTQDLAKYYVKALQEGLAYFTATYEGYSGQVPIIPVCVKAAGGQGPALSTDIDDQVSKYDILYFTPQEGSFSFTFTAATEDGTVLSALVNDVAYEPDDNGVFTVPLRDKYNPIVVTAAKDGKTTAIAYSIRAKALGIAVSNLTREGSTEFYEGDTVEIALTGLVTPVPKVSRIYNPSSLSFAYDSEMPRYHVIESRGAQYVSGAISFELTGAGEFTLVNGRVLENWFGSGLYSETPVGTAPPNTGAGQTWHTFSVLPDVQITVLENPAYNPADVLPTSIIGGNTVEAGSEATLSIPGIDTEMLRNLHTSSSEEWMTTGLLDSYTVFATDIPGLAQVKSVNVATTAELDSLKTIAFTVPADTPPGEYRLKGGYIWVKYGPTWWTKETKYYVGKMEDATLTVLAQTGEVDKAGLTGKIAVTGTLVEAWYTGESWSAFAAALAAAQAVAQDPDATQQEVDAALAALTSAMDTLIFKADSAKAETIQNILGAISNGLKGSGADWDVMDMAAYGLGGSMDKDTLVAKALEVYHKANPPATDYERVAISLTSLGLNARAVDDTAGGTADFIGKIANYNPTSLGTINAYIYALIAYDSGNYELPPTANWTREKIWEHILTAQLADGGWALSGSTADPDVTAMAISALANYQNEEDIANAIEDAVACLSARQTANGGFKSWGTENSNSTSMVIVALAALGIDADTDSRFIKAGKSPIDALLSYKTADNRLGYNNTNYNAMATEQGFRALVAYTKMLAAGTAYNIYNFQDGSTSEPQPVDKSNLNAKIADAQALNQADYTAATWSALSTALDIAIAIRDRETANQAEVYDALKNLTAAVNGLKTPDGPGGDTITVSFKLLGDAKHGTEGTRHVYKNNPGSFQTWIPATSVTVPKNSTVYDVFTQVLDDNGLQYDETQANYIGGIKAPASFGGHWLYEFDNGPLSGWMYTVNGTHPSLGLRERVLRDGDIIVWHYTDDYTKEEGSEKWDNPGSGAAKTPVVSSGKEFSADRLKELREGNESLELQYGHLNISLNPQDLPVITDGKIKIETSLISETTALNSFFLAYPGLTGVLKGFSITLTEESSSGKTQPLTQLNGNIDLHFALEANEIKGLDPSTLIVYKQGEDGKVTEYPGTYDWTKGTVSISTNHLCKFFIMGREGIPSQRLSGDDRYATAVAVSARGWPASDHVILAGGENFPDALAATALAGLKNAPVLLTAKEALNSRTLAEIKRLQAKTIWLIGGTGVISQAIEDQLKKDYTVTRLYGNDRYGTALKIGEQLREEKSPDTAILSTGLNYPDALSIAPFAGKSAYPILFSGQGDLNGQTKEALVAWGIKNVYILGGSGVIPAGVEDTLKGLGIKVTRLAGNDRYETSLAIVKHFADPAAPYTKAALATGLNFPDALAGGALAAREGYPVLLVGSDAAAEQVRNYLQALLPETIYLYGGEKVIPDQLRYRISLKTL